MTLQPHTPPKKTVYKKANEINTTVHKSQHSKRAKTIKTDPNVTNNPKVSNILPPYTILHDKK